MKKFFISIFIVLVLFSGSLTIPPVREKVFDAFWDAISYQLDKEEKEREEKYARHEVVRGKDTAYIWNKHYEIWSHMGEKNFSIEIEDTSDDIFRKVTHIDVYKDCFYVISKEGYAVVDRENYCRVYLDPLEDVEFMTTPVESKYVKYLDSYSDFTDKEKKHFNKMETKNRGATFDTND